MAIVKKPNLVKPITAITEKNREIISSWEKPTHKQVEEMLSSISKRYGFSGWHDAGEKLGYAERTVFQWVSPESPRNDISRVNFQTYCILYAAMTGESYVKTVPIDSKNILCYIVPKKDYQTPPQEILNTFIGKWTRAGGVGQFNVTDIMSNIGVSRRFIEDFANARFSYETWICMVLFFGVSPEYIFSENGILRPPRTT